MYTKIAKLLAGKNVEFNKQGFFKDTLGFEHYAELLIKPTESDCEYVLKVLKEHNAPYLVVGGMFNTFLSSVSYSVIISIANLYEDDGASGFYSASEKIPNVVSHFVDQDSRIVALKGIPGTLGGAIAMNAGAYGVCISDFIHSVKLLTDEGISEISKNEIEFGYRTALFPCNRPIILGATLIPADKSIVMELENEEKQKEFRLKYTERSQPNLGSTFATKNIYQLLRLKKRSRVLTAVYSQLPVRMLLRLVDAVFKTKISGFRNVFIWHILKRLVSYKTTCKVSDKTLNTFCFDRMESLQTNAHFFSDYIKVIRELTDDTIKEEVKIF